MKVRIFKVTTSKPLTEGVRLIKGESLPAVREFLTKPLFEIEPATPEDVADHYATNPKATIESAVEVEK